jgi:Gas vesicle protein G
MSLFTLPFTLPLLPVRAVIKLGELIQDRAEEELHDPAAVRRELEAVEEAQRVGKLSPEEAEEAEQHAISRLIGTVPHPADPGQPGDDRRTRS